MVTHFRAMAELVRIHRGASGEMDVDAFRWLLQHELPLAHIGPLSSPMVTDEGARLISELLAIWEDQT
jgi:hypothetical protein